MLQDGCKTGEIAIITLAACLQTIELIGVIGARWWIRTTDPRV
jgi:hypothetical protein